MNGLSVLMLGIGLGLRHAIDADHIVVVSGLVQRETSVWRAARVAALWGVGHTATFLGLGFLIVLAEVRLPPNFERTAELLVAVMLMSFGAWHLARSGTASVPGSAAQAASTYAYVRPVLIGLVHGLAGSAGIALLVATTITSRALAAAYLSLFGLGTVIGMVALTVVTSRPITWSMQRNGRVKQGLVLLASLLSMLLGGALFIRTVFGEAAP